MHFCRVAGIHDIQVKPLISVFKVFAILPAFWMLFDNASNLWTNQAKFMSVPHWISPAIVQIYNSMFILVCPALG